MGARLRISIITPHDPALPNAGGVAAAMDDLARQLAWRGHDVTLLGPTAGPSRASFEGGVRVARVHRRLLGGLAGHLPRESRVVHVPASDPRLASAVLRAARWHRIPAVLDARFLPAFAGLGAADFALADAVLVRSRAEARACRALRGVPEARWVVAPPEQPGAVLHAYARALGKEVMPPARLGRHAVL